MTGAGFTTTNPEKTSKQTGALELQRQVNRKRKKERKKRRKTGTGRRVEGHGRSPMATRNNQATGHKSSVKGHFSVESVDNADWRGQAKRQDL